MASKVVRNDLIPLRAGIVRLTPILADGTPDYDNCITTKRNFLTSTQITTSRDDETLANGNGNDKTFPTSETHTLALNTLTYDPKFHKALSGDEVVATPLPILFDTSIEVLEDNSAYEANLTAHPPVTLTDGKYHFEIRDSYGNLLEEADTLAEGKYKYDPDTKKLSFDVSAENKTFSCVYYIAATEGEAYQASPILKNPQFMVEVLAEMQSADTGEQTRYYAKMPRATISGDVPRVTSQKSISNTITYTFASAPVPEGTSAFYESFTPVATA